MQSKSDHGRIAAALVALILGSSLLGCSHYVTAEIALSRSIQAVDLPEPEIVPARDLDARRDEFQTVSIYLIQDAQRGDEIRELERSFLRAGYQIREARALESGRSLPAALEGTTSDVIVVVYKLESTDVTSAEVSARPVFSHGRSLSKLVPATPDEIEQAVSRIGSMTHVVADVKQRMAEDGVVGVAGARAAFVDAKILDGQTHEALMFYRAYTFVDAGDLELGDSAENIAVGTYRYNSNAGAFLPLETDASKAAEPTYGDLSVKKSYEDPGLALRDAHLELVKQACDDLVRTFQTPDALRY